MWNIFSTLESWEPHRVVTLLPPEDVSTAWVQCRTSDQDVGGFLGRIAHVVGRHAAVGAAVFHCDSGDGQRAAIDDAPLRELLPSRPHPGQSGRRVSARRHAGQSDGLARVHHQGVVQEELNGGRSWREGRREKTGCYWAVTFIIPKRLLLSLWSWLHLMLCSEISTLNYE